MSPSLFLYKIAIPSPEPLHDLGPDLEASQYGTPLQYSCLENPMGGEAW